MVRISGISNIPIEALFLAWSRRLFRRQAQFDLEGPFRGRVPQEVSNGSLAVNRRND